MNDENGYYGEKVDPQPNAAYSVTRGEKTPVERGIEKLTTDTQQIRATVEQIGERAAPQMPDEKYLTALIKSLIPAPIKGDKGERGDKGAKGDTGANGKDGVNGKDGHTPTRDELLALITPLIPGAGKGNKS